MNGLEKNYRLEPCLLIMSVVELEEVVSLATKKQTKILKVKGITDSVLQEWLNIKGNWKLWE